MNRRILIVDDHAVVRRGLKDIVVDSFPGTEVLEAADVDSAEKLVGKESLSAVILDISLPGRSGLDLLRELRQSQPNLPVLVLSMHPEEQFAVRVLKSGAAGYLTKDSAPEELAVALRAILLGNKYIQPSVAVKLTSHLNANGKNAPHERLSDREYEVLCMIGSGKTVSEIAGILSLSVKTVSTYRVRILEKMGMETSAQLTAYAVKHKIVS